MLNKFNGTNFYIDFENILPTTVLKAFSALVLKLSPQALYSDSVNEFLSFVMHKALAFR